MEIERKFLVLNNDFKSGVEGVPYRQGYLSNHPLRTVRVRIAGDKGYLTVKGATSGISREEFEYDIPVADALAMLNSICLPYKIEKTRYKVGPWEVDVFHGDNEGLVVAEIELESEGQSFDKPDWLGAEVSDDIRYYNSNLTMHPFKDW